MASALKDANTEVALLIVALEAPAFLWVVLHAELSAETPDAEVDGVVVVEARNLGTQEHVSVRTRILGQSH